MALDWQTEYHRYQRYFVNINQFYRQKKIRVYTGIVLSIFAVSFFIFFAIKPTLVTIAGLMKEIDDKKVITEKLETKINALASAQREYQNVESDLYLVDEALPQDSQVSFFIKQLEALARKSGVAIEGVQINQVALKESAPADGSQSISFSIAAFGSYQNLVSYLQTVSSLRRIITIESFAIMTPKEDQKEKALRLTLNAKAFFMKGDK